MRPHTEHSSYDADASSAPELRAIEALLDSMARAAQPPAALVDRVFTASAALLPRTGPVIARIDRSGRRAIVAQQAGRRTLRLAVWSRLALAACVAIAFGLSFNVLRDSATAPMSAGMGAMIADDPFLVMTRAGGDRVGHFLGVDGIGPLADDDAYLESFGIFGTRVDDLLGDPSSFDDAIGG